ncbi:MAG: riboflavin biosynthesis protein RibD [Chromatiales bacterium 21-64-14]|nr:MAG: riboflavin biosynthesis protein RibD [Chromatiales bacterium 21-64-14]HQU15576.1 bifunctional diaminohydroxyphosphoribosylaminopyrimidine deaminase/5-amino-6-(5-phosphoribosylamino)uracil reductase RibD [Gammaproteobacteria bacterium]
MARALELAALGLYTTDPNPRVGCVLVRDGCVVGEGWHRRAGEPHAEVRALRAAGADARGASAYVTLEPCCHLGRTPPCTDALVEAGVAAVVAAMTDPNPRVAGRGVERLRAAGITVRTGLLEDRARALNPGFARRMESGRPFVRFKSAMSLDGRTALASGFSQWITGAAARADVQRLRARSSAIMVGVDTALADDPSLTVRLTPVELGLEPDLPSPQPLRVVVDSRLRLPPAARMIGLPGRTLVATVTDQGAAGSALAQRGVELVALPGGDGRVDLAALLTFLGRREINEVLLEGGSVLGGAMLRAGLVDEFVLYLAPHLLGDAGRGLVHLPGLQSMDERIGLEILDVRAVGRDWRIVARPGVAPS